MFVKRFLILTGLLAVSLSICESVQPAGLDQAPPDRLLTDQELLALYEGKADGGLEELAGKLRAEFAERYYFDWRNVDKRFAYYKKHFGSKYSSHKKNAEIHQGLYPADTQWKLPFTNLKGAEVTAYELRHLARSHKVLDMAFMHLYEDRNPEYVRYFSDQMRSLNRAFEAGEYEDDEGGNGVYESFRAGYRVMNWLQVHGFYLGSGDYGWQDQVELIRTMLHTGAILHEKNQKFRYGNHQTRGVAALAMIAILLQDFAGTETWYEKAMEILGQHLEKEVNADGFQFERSVHYHIGDIYNFFRVMQLAQINDFPVPNDWRDKLEGMFDAAITLARPDRRLPVLQDDTDQPWAEYNEMGDFMLLGSILFDDPEINYFASNSVADSVYWWLRAEQIEGIGREKRSKPQRLSGELPITGYYVMREGWDKGDAHLVISAGLSEHKPDHQHGDMLGIVARANRQDILPNYQVRYSLPDYEYFKNSLVKNVAIVDGIPHGRGWKGNKGGSGFGKWEKLPQPRVIAWVKQDDWDFFAGSHDGYADLGVAYYRKVLFIKGLGWIVRDLFESSNGEHDFQQVWQGHYSDEGSGNHHRSAFADGSGLEILQLGDQAGSWSTGSRRGKGKLVYSMSGESGSYTTLLYPFKGFSSRIPDSFFEEGRVALNGWTIHRQAGTADFGAFSTDAPLVVEGNGGAFLLGASRVLLNGKTFRFPGACDLYLEDWLDGSARIISLEHEAMDWTSDTGDKGRVAPGEVL